MTGVLPESITVGGRAYPIRADFRNILRIFEAFNDAALTKEEKACICIRRLYREPIPPAHLEEAVRKAFLFCDGKPEDGRAEEPAEPSPKLFDWKGDEAVLFPAVNRAAGFEVRSCGYLHWWTFLGFFGEMQEGLFSQILHIRQKRAKGKKLESWEKEFVRDHKRLVLLRTPEEQAAMEETEAFLRTIL